MQFRWPQAGPRARDGWSSLPSPRWRQAPRRFFVLGNHECYSGAAQWIEHFRALGIQVLLNEYRVLSIGSAKLVVGGVLDPATGQPLRPDLAAGAAEGDAFRLLLAHNPK